MRLSEGQLVAWELGRIHLWGRGDLHTSWRADAF